MTYDKRPSMMKKEAESLLRRNHIKWQSHEIFSHKRYHVDILR